MNRQTEPFKGWRVFRLKRILEKDPVLVSIANPVVWQGRRLLATGKPRWVKTEKFLLRSFFQPSGSKYRNGIFAMSQPVDLGELYRDSWYLPNDGLVTATIDLEGHVLECEKGLRGEKATLTSIDLRYIPCSAQGFLKKFFSISGCNGRVTHWCETGKWDSQMQVPKTRGFCAEHANLELPNMTIEEVADALLIRYECPIIV